MLLVVTSHHMPQQAMHLDFQVAQLPREMLSRGSKTEQSVLLTTGKTFPIHQIWSTDQSEGLGCKDAPRLGGLFLESQIGLQRKPY